jgi:hypothetical protein
MIGCRGHHQAGRHRDEGNGDQVDNLCPETPADLSQGNALAVKFSYTRIWLQGR